MTDTKFTEASEPEMVKRNSASMKRLEAIWGEVIRRMDSRMDDSGTCPNAHGLCDAEDIRASLTILHRKMDKFAATHGNVPIARSGER